ncbi:MAG: recombinase family protein [Myxococcales bacterium]|nr:recombinase family protein [Myxococcales bacterium]
MRQLQGENLAGRRRERSRRAKECAAAKAETGWFPAKAPFGYVNVKDLTEDGAVKERGGKIVLTDWGRRVVHRIFQLRAEGHSLECIAVEMTEMGVGSYKKMKRFSGSGRKQAVQNILTNVFYKGQFQWDGRIYEGMHEPAVSIEQWAKVQPGYGRPVVSQRKRDAALSGWLRCEECGCQISYDPKTKPSGKTYEYYRCANGKRVHSRTKYVLESDILDGFSKALDDIYLTEKMAEQFATAMNQANNKARQSKRGEARKHELARSSWRSSKTSYTTT